MSDETKDELAPVNQSDLASLLGGTDQQALAGFDKVSKSGDWFDRIQLIGSNSALAKEKKIESGHYAYIAGKSYIDLGTSVDLLFLKFRLTAMRFKEGAINTFYDCNTPEFKAIQNEANTIQDSGCTYGPEFLVWCPKLSKFATFYCNSKSLRAVAPQFRDAQDAHVALTLGSELTKKGKYTWEIPTVSNCTTPIAMPPRGELIDAASRFDQQQKVKKPEANTNAAPERQR